MLLLSRLRLCLCSPFLHTFYGDVVCAVIFLLVLAMWFGFTYHTAGLSKAIDCNKCCEPVCFSHCEVKLSGLL